MLDERKSSNLFLEKNQIKCFFLSCQEIPFFRQQHILDLLLQVLYIHSRHHEQTLPYRQVNYLLIVFFLILN